MGKFTKEKIVACVLILLGVIGLVGEVVLIATYEKYLSLEWSHPGSRWNYLAFFTEITNIVVDLWLIALGIAMLIGEGRVYRFLTKPHVQGALTLYILVVGIVYCGILFWFTETYSAVHWWGNLINVWHHVVVPIGMVVLWWKMPHTGHVNKKTLWYWMILPVVYLIVSEIRGLIDGWYPYPFLDPQSVLFPIGLVTLLLIFAGFGFAMIWVHNEKADKVKTGSVDS
jgi:hypothetical protein